MAVRLFFRIRPSNGRRYRDPYVHCKGKDFAVGLQKRRNEGSGDMYKAFRYKEEIKVEKSPSEDFETVSESIRQPARDMTA